MIGNAFWDNTGPGILNEAFVNDSVAQGNVLYRNDAASSVATRWNLIDNLFFEGGVSWNNLDNNPLRDGYMLLRRNAFINPRNGYLSGFASGYGQYAWPEVFRNCVVDRNRVWLPKDSWLIYDGAKNYNTLTKSARSSSGNSTARCCPTIRTRTRSRPWDRASSTRPL